jgi:hypothetical protein
LDCFLNPPARGNAVDLNINVEGKGSQVNLPLVLFGDLFSQVGEPFPKVGQLFPGVGEPFPKVRELFPMVGEPFSQVWENKKRPGLIYRSVLIYRF